MDIFAKLLFVLTLACYCPYAVSILGSRSCQNRDSNVRCERRAQLCISPAKYRGMYRRCASTCNRCPGECIDIGYDCATNGRLHCDIPHFRNLVDWQCPKTCGCNRRSEPFMHIPRHHRLNHRVTHENTHHPYHPYHSNHRYHPYHPYHAYHPYHPLHQVSYNNPAYTTYADSFGNTVGYNPAINYNGKSPGNCRDNIE